MAPPASAPASVAPHPRPNPAHRHTLPAPDYAFEAADLGGPLVEPTSDINDYTLPPARTHQQRARTDLVTTASPSSAKSQQLPSSHRKRLFSRRSDYGPTSPVTGTAPANGTATATATATNNNATNTNGSLPRKNSWALNLKRKATLLAEQFGRLGQSSATAPGANGKRIVSQVEFRRNLRKNPRDRTIKDVTGDTFRLVDIPMNGDCGFASIAQGINLACRLGYPLPPSETQPFSYRRLLFTANKARKKNNGFGKGNMKHSDSSAAVTEDSAKKGSSVNNSDSGSTIAEAAGKNDANNNSRISTKQNGISTTTINNSSQTNGNHPPDARSPTASTASASTENKSLADQQLAQPEEKEKANAEEEKLSSISLKTIKKPLQPSDVRVAMYNEIKKERTAYLEELKRFSYTDADFDRLEREVSRPGLSGHWLGTILGLLEHVIISRALNINIYLYQFDLQKQGVRQFEYATVDNAHCDVYLFFTGPPVNGHFDVLQKMSSAAKQPNSASAGGNGAAASEKDTAGSSGGNRRTSSAANRSSNAKLSGKANGEYEKSNGGGDGIVNGVNKEAPPKRNGLLSKKKSRLAISRQTDDLRQPTTPSHEQLQSERPLQTEPLSNGLNHGLPKIEELQFEGSS